MMMVTGANAGYFQGRGGLRIRALNISFLPHERNTAKNIVISPNFPEWKFCAFPQNLHIRKSGEITVFFAAKNTAGKNIHNVLKLFFFLEKFQPQKKS